MIWPAVFILTLYLSSHIKEEEEGLLFFFYVLVFATEPEMGLVDLFYTLNISVILH